MFSRNLFKSDKQAGIDPLSGKKVALFHPLLQNWNDHFSWDETKTHIIGISDVGRATVEVLQMNNTSIVFSRQRWVSAGWHPPGFEEE